MKIITQLILSAAVAVACGLALAQSASQVATGSYLGTYKGKVSDDNVLTVVSANSNTFKFKIELNGSNGKSGMTEGEAVSRGADYVFKDKEGCQINFKFLADVATVKQAAGTSAACGFGMGIIADGVFSLKKAAVKTADKKGTAEIPEQFAGKWAGSKRECKAVLLNDVGFEDKTADIGKKSIVFASATCDVRESLKATEPAFSGAFQCASEGDKFKMSATLTLQGPDKLVIAVKGKPENYMRCK